MAEKDAKVTMLHKHLLYSRKLDLEFKSHRNSLFGMLFPLKKIKGR